jgi:catechol 2,3-dioxygenase-like lactoylglutathione lyase family enzyme
MRPASADERRACVLMPMSVCEAINATLRPMGDFRAGIWSRSQHLRSAMVNGRAHIILKTLDIRETIRWYTASGFELRDQFPSSEPTWCELMRGDLVIQFLAGDTPWPGTPTMTGCLYVYSPNVAAVHDELSGVIDLEWGIEDREWGRRELVVRDPNGYFLTFAEDTDEPTPA